MKKVLTSIIAILVAGTVITGCSSNKESASSESEATKRSYPVKLINNIVINPATAGIRFSVTNDGTQPVKPSCTVRMQDSSGTYKGFDIVEPLEPISPNQTQQFVLQLTITNEGAYFANEFSAECTAYTTDTGTNAGTEVIVYDIEDASWGDDQYELDQNKEFPEDAGFWYGPTFKVNQPFMTQMDCTWTAFDKNGNVVGTHSFRANTDRLGGINSYGPDEKWYIDSTQKIVNSVETYEVSCRL